MTPKAILEAASSAQPEMMKKVAAMMFLAERLDDGLAAQAARDLSTILERSVDGMEKVSAYSPAARVGIAAGGAVLGALGTAVASDLYDAARRGLTASRNFNNILKHNPTLAENHDKTTLRRAFDSLHRYGPEFTADPLVGGSYLHALAADPSHSLSMVKDFTSARKNLIETKRKQFEPKLHDLGHTFLEAHDRLEDRAEQVSDIDRREKFDTAKADTEHGRRLRQELRRTAEEKGKETRQQEFQRKLEAQKARISRTGKGQDRAFNVHQQQNMFGHQFRLEDYKQGLRVDSKAREELIEDLRDQLREATKNKP